ncbi:GTPase IMAP family member 8-like [Babylonia areolata]|uniref:GTPase IMAP family member 8-like n=1 Tax=Babylonia areolata TaxID=304850 RepID=UPI003FD30765
MDSRQTEGEETGETGEDVFDDSPPSPSPSSPALQERRLIIIGKTGNGKSSVGNLLLGKPHFPVGFSMTSTTGCASSGTANFRGWAITVLDTPDLSNMACMDEDEAQREVSRWQALTSPKVHAILLAVRCDVRYTREEYEIFLQMKKQWGGKPLTRRLVVAFTFGDRQDRDIEEDLKRVCPELKSVLKEASDRYMVFNDMDSPEGKHAQALRLMRLVDRLDAQVLKKEERRLLTGFQVCPQGPGCPAPPSSPQQRLFSGGSTSSRGSTGVDPDCIKLVLVGRPGTGKSSTGNTILGRAAFAVHHRVIEPIHESQMEEVEINGKLVQVVDTPGLLQKQTAPGDGKEQGHGQEDRATQDYHRQGRRASQLLSPGPHALLYVVRHRNVTQEDLAGFRTLRQTLGQGLSHHTIVALVGGPQGSALHAGHCPEEEKEEEEEKESGGGQCPTLEDGRRSSTSQPMEDGRRSSATEGAQAAEGEAFQTLLKEAGNKLWLVSNAEVPVVGARERQVDVLMGLVRGILNNSGGDCFYANQAAARRMSNDETKAQARKGSCWFL